MARCGAYARTTKAPCRAQGLANGKCRNHGGLSTGPKTPEGKKRIGEALKVRLAQGQLEKAMAGYQSWLHSGGRELLKSKAFKRANKRRG